MKTKTKKHEIQVARKEIRKAIALGEIGLNAEAMYGVAMGSISYSTRPAVVKDFFCTTAVNDELHAAELEKNKNILAESFAILFGIKTAC